MKTNYIGKKANQTYLTLHKNILIIIFTLLTPIILLAGDVTVTITDCNGIPLSGATYSIYIKDSYFIAANVAANVTTPVADGKDYLIFAQHNNTATEPIAFTTSSNGNHFDFKTTNVQVNLYASGKLRWHNGSSIYDFTRMYYTDLG